MGNRAPDRVPKRLTPPVQAWYGLFAARNKIMRLQAREEDLVYLAAFCCLLGPPAIHQAAHWAVVSLFFKDKRTRLWQPTLQALPYDKDVWLAVTEAAKAFNEHSSKDLSKFNLKLDAVVPSMATVVDPEDYVRERLKEGFTHPGAMFHPNTVQQSQRELRGKTGPLADEGAVADILARVEVISA